MKTFSLRPWILSSSRWRQKPCSSRTRVLAGWLRAEKRGVRFTAATTAQWDTCPWQPQELGGPAGPTLCGALLRTLPLPGKTNLPPVRKAQCRRVFFEKNLFWLMPLCGGFLPQALKVKALHDSLGCFSEEPHSSEFYKSWSQRPAFAWPRTKHSFSYPRSTMF